MGGGGSSVVTEYEMMNVSDFNHNTTNRSNERTMYPTNTDDSCVSRSKGINTRGHMNQCNGTHIGSDVMKRSSTPDSLSPDTLSHSSQGSSHSIGIDAVSTLNQSSSPLHSTPKKHNHGTLPKTDNRSGSLVQCNGSHGDSGTESLGNRLCNCDGNNSSCEIIVTTHESVVAKKLLNSSFRKSRSLSDAVLLERGQQKPKWKIEVDMECTRVIYGSLERDADVSMETQKNMKDESTETEDGKDCRYGDEDYTGENTFNSVSESEDDMKKKKHFWTKKKKRKGSLEKENSKAAMSENGSTLRHKHFWPFLKTDASNRPVYPYTQKQDRYKQSLYEEKLKYLHIAARVSSPRVADVRATLLVQTPAKKLTNAQLSAKTYLLSVTLNAFFYPYPETYAEWIESLSEIIQQRIERGDIVPKFDDSAIFECKMCLILTPDAGILLGKPDSALIHDLANIAGYSPKNTLVMEVTDGTSSTPERFAPICELEEFEEDNFEDEDVVHENGTQTKPENV